MSKIEQHQWSLKLLVIIQIASMILAIIALISFPEPEEITAATTVMEELDDSSGGGFYLFTSLSLIVGYLGLWIWSLWQLYHLNQNGFPKFVGAVVLRWILTFVAGGSWETTMVSFFDEIHFLSAGAIIYIGFYFSEAFDELVQEMQGNTDDPASIPEETTGESQ